MQSGNSYQHRGTPSNNSTVKHDAVPIITAQEYNDIFTKSQKEMSEL